jgi:ketosteroid isomerase-like protein
LNEVSKPLTQLLQESRTEENHASSNQQRRDRGPRLQAFNEADIDTLTESFDDNASWITPGQSPAAGNRRGRDAVFAQFGRYGGETGGTFKAELKYVAEDAEGRVVGFHHNSGERNGKRLDTDCCIVSS